MNYLAFPEGPSPQLGAVFVLPISFWSLAPSVVAVVRTAQLCGCVVVSCCALSNRLFTALVLAPSLCVLLLARVAPDASAIVALSQLLARFCTIHQLTIAPRWVVSS